MAPVRQRDGTATVQPCGMFFEATNCSGTPYLSAHYLNAVCSYKGTLYKSSLPMVQITWQSADEFGGGCQPPTSISEKVLTATTIGPSPSPFALPLSIQ